jgi:DNA polymerase-3 subunit chi
MSEVTEVKFYHNAPDRLVAACSIAAKAVRQGRRVVVHAPDAALAQRFDNMLWSAQPLSFVPHVTADSPLAARTPVVIATGLDNLPNDGTMSDVLVNLGDGVNNRLPQGYTRFRMLVEIVSTQEADRQQARQRWQAFKELGLPITAYDLAKTA